LKKTSEIDFKDFIPPNLLKGMVIFDETNRLQKNGETVSSRRF